MQELFFPLSEYTCKLIYWTMVMATDKKLKVNRCRRVFWCSLIWPTLKKFGGHPPPPRGLGMWSIIIIIALFHDHFWVLSAWPDVFSPNSCLRCLFVSFPYLFAYSWSTQWRFFHHVMLWNVSAVSLSAYFVRLLNHKNYFVVNVTKQRLKRMLCLCNRLCPLITNKVCLITASFDHISK